MESFFGSARRNEFQTYMTGFAAKFGVSIGSPDHIPNTRRALAITEYARDQGKLEEFRDATMAAHWFEGKNIENDDDLKKIAASVGLDGGSALGAADDPRYLGRVDELRKEATLNQITGIPTFVLGDQKVVGCQPYQVIEQRALAAGFQKR